MSYRELKKEINKLSYNDLKEVLDNYNWDDGLEIPEEMLKNQNCDLALALEIFYLADGFTYLVDGVDYADDDASTWLKEWGQFIETLYQDILNGKYPKTGNHYEIPLNKVQRYRLGKNSVPEVFLVDL